jgi:hypothetical protein
MFVVDDLFTDIDRSSVEFERLFDCNDCSVNACAITTWRS